MMRGVVLLGLAVVLLVVSTAGASATGTTYVPKAGDGFHYYENIELANGTGNYTGYSESTFYNGTIGVASVQTNGTESATWSDAWSFSNSQGQKSSGTDGPGTFTFSAVTDHYVQGTDNQTGDNGTGVWFLVDRTLGAQATYQSLSTTMKVVSTNASYPLWTQGGKWVATVFAEGNSSYQRNDVYGVFTASYNWKEYYDPTTGYIVGYLLTETDSDGSGDGFTIIEALGVTSTTYALTPGVAPPPSTSSGAPNAGVAAVVLVAVLVVVVLIVVGLYLLVRSRRRTGLTQHSRSGPVQYAAPPPPMGPPPPALRFDPGPEPAVQQIIVRETVKVPCRYCGTLIDSTATVCPKCGAPRT